MDLIAEGIIRKLLFFLYSLGIYPILFFSAHTLIVTSLDYANSDDYYGMDGYGVRFVFVEMAGRQQRMDCKALRKVTDVAQEIVDVRQAIAEELLSIREYRNNTTAQLQKYL